ncbi:hypothetical protein ABZS76_33060 [Streptomyces sp. NPDC005562]|uniref:hypothetical protein n=1 Tax=Streptomyces sp. NPDC005562 TaxID=3154890 RepID=UPI00339F5DED
MATDQHPYRVADREGEGWLRNGPDDTYTTFPKTGLGDLTYEELEAARGPLRPVEAMATEDHAVFAQAIAQAGKKGMASFLSALHRTALELMEQNGTVAALTAGRTGSWEANLLRGSVIWEGEGLSASRVDPAAVDTMHALLAKWTTGPTQVELAEGLGYILADAAKQAGGWDAITDRWLKNKESIERWTAAHRL